MNDLLDSIIEGLILGIALSYLVFVFVLLFWDFQTAWYYGWRVFVFIAAAVSVTKILQG